MISEFVIIPPPQTLIRLNLYKKQTKKANITLSLDPCPDFMKSLVGRANFHSQKFKVDYHEGTRHFHLMAHQIKVRQMNTNLNLSY